MPPERYKILLILFSTVRHPLTRFESGFKGKRVLHIRQLFKKYSGKPDIVAMAQKLEDILLSGSTNRMLRNNGHFAPVIESVHACRLPYK